jgi:hypothetical protein
MTVPGTGYSRLSNRLTMSVPGAGYSRLSNLLTMTVPGAGYSRLSNLLTMSVPGAGYSKKHTKLYIYTFIYNLYYLLITFRIIPLGILASTIYAPNRHIISSIML